MSLESVDVKVKLFSSIHDLWIAFLSRIFWFLYLISRSSTKIKLTLTHFPCVEVNMELLSPSTGITHCLTKSRSWRLSRHAYIILKIEISDLENLQIGYRKESLIVPISRTVPGLGLIKKWPSKLDQGITKPIQYHVEERTWLHDYIWTLFWSLRQTFIWKFLLYIFPAGNENWKFS